MNLAAIAQQLKSAFGFVTVKRDLVTGGSVISLPSGPFVMSKILLADDLSIDRVISGLALPNAGGLSQTVAPGVAVVAGSRIGSAGAAITLYASSDNYVDLSVSGSISVKPVTVGVAAPALGANSIRLGYITTGTSSISGVVITGKDTFGNPLRNTSGEPGCVLSGAISQSATGGADNYIAFATPSLELADNANMHSATANPTRITIQKSGLYIVSAGITWASGGGTVYFTVRKNGGLAAGMYQDVVSNGGALSAGISGLLYLNAGEYLEARVSPGTSITLSSAHFSAARVG